MAQKARSTAVPAAEQEPAEASAPSGDQKGAAEDSRVKKRGRGADDAEDIQRKKVPILAFIRHLDRLMDL